jgi:CBS domain containing-hemolysin-like protein
VSVLLPYLGLVAFLLACSAFFSGSESALFSLDRYELEKLEAEDPDASATAVRSLLAEPRRLLATILLGNELVNVTLSTVGLAAILAVARARHVESVPWWINIVVVTPLLLLFGEVAPKAVAIRLGMRWARAVAIPMRLFGTAVAPLRMVLHGIAEAILRGVGIEPSDPLPDALKEAQFKALVRLGEQEGVLEPDEAELIHRVFDLSDTPVSRIMTPRSEVISVARGAPLEDLLERVRKSRFSRVPVHGGEPGSIHGILLTKELMPYLYRDKTPPARTLDDLVVPAYFVPPGKMCDELLAEFQAERGHMAVVLDEQGGLVGIVTLQDILDQLFVTRVEEIEQRADHPQPERIADGLYRIPARLEVTDWNRTLEPQIPEGDSYNTVAGYIFHLFGRLPAKGETIRDAGWSYRVSSIEGTRLTWITARRRERLP